MTTECTPALADEWGTSFDDEIRQFRDEWETYLAQHARCEAEKRRLDEKMIELIKKSVREGWRLTPMDVYYGRNSLRRMKGTA